MRERPGSGGLQPRELNSGVMAIVLPDPWGRIAEADRRNLTAEEVHPPAKAANARVEPARRTQPDCRTDGLVGRL